MNATTWTTRMIASLTTKAQAKWTRMHKATNTGARAFWEREYNRTMFAVRYLESRLEVN